MYEDQNNNGRVEFNEVEFHKSRADSSKSGTGLKEKLVQSGIVQDEQQAGYVLIGIAVLVILLSWWIWPSGSQERAGDEDPAPAIDPTYAQ